MCDSVEDVIADAQVFDGPRLLKGGAVSDEPIAERAFLTIQNDEPLLSSSGSIQQVLAVVARDLVRSLLARDAEPVELLATV